MSPLLPKKPHRKSQTDGNSRSSRELIMIFHMAYGVELIKALLMSRNELTGSHRGIKSSFVTFFAARASISNQHTTQRESECRGRGDTAQVKSK